MGHGGRRGRDQGPRSAAGESEPGRSWRSMRTGFGFAPTSTAASASWDPRPRWRCRRRCGSDIALVFDECTPFHVTRDYTARSTERTHRWLERCLRWHEQHGPPGQVGLRDRPGRRRAGPAAGVGRRRSRRAPATGSRSAARSGRTRRRCTRSCRGPRPNSSDVAPQRPRHLLGNRRRRRPDRRRRARDRHVRLRDADAARRATAWRWSPIRRRRWRVDLVKATLAGSSRADPRRLPMPGVRRRLHARLPALPTPRRRADRACDWSRCTTSASSRADAGPPRRDRRRAPR